MAIFEYRYKVGLTDINRNNEISNKAIIKILENAASMHSELVGYGVNDIPRTGISWIVLGWKIKVNRRVRFNQEIIAKTWGRSYNRATMLRDYKIVDENNNIIAIATSKWAIISAKDGKLMELTDEIVKGYECQEEKVFEDEYKFKLIEPKGKLIENKIEIQRRDIDINKHVHNLYYLDYAYESLPEEIYDKEECNNIEIMYKRQIKYDDKIKCIYSNETENTIMIKSDDDKILHSIIKLY